MESIYTRPFPDSVLAYLRYVSTLSSQLDNMDYLTGLPAEMVSAITFCLSLSSRDLLALRLVSRFVCACSEDAFLQRFFVNRRHLDTPYGLEALVRISEHPVLRKKLQSIEIRTVAPQYRNARVPSSLQHGGPFQGPCDEDLCVQSQENGGMPNQDRGWSVSYWPNYQENRDRMRDPCLDLLVAALRNLAEAGIFISLSSRKWTDRDVKLRYMLYERKPRAGYSPDSPEDYQKFPTCDSDSPIYHPESPEYDPASPVYVSDPLPQVAHQNGHRSSSQPLGGPGFVTYGESRLGYWGIQVYTFDHMGSDAQDAMALLLLAVKSASYPASGLAIGEYGFDRIDTDVYSILDSLPPPALVNLRSLSLSIPVRSGTVASAAFSPVGDWLQALPGLHALDLSLDQCITETYPISLEDSELICTWLNASQIEELTLRGCHFGLPALRKLLASQKSSLRRLSLFHVGLQVPYHWRDAFAWIAGYLSLDYVHLGGLEQGNGEPWIVGRLQQGHSDIEYDSAISVKEGLERLSREAIFSF